jgi:hypothetical protein
MRRLLVLLLLFFAAIGAKSQCANELNSISYDTTVNALGNSLYTFSFPKFDPAVGTLTEVKINTKVTLVYSFRLENGEINPVNNYRVRVFRDDEVSSAALQTPLTNSYQKQYGYYSLAGSDGVPNSGADFTQQGPLYVMNQQAINYTVYNTADFFGQGMVDFDYATSTYSAAQGSINNNLDGSAQDAVNFKIIYTYCPNLTLATDITSFTVHKVNDGMIDIKWITQNEKPNRNYELQKSKDGRNFRSVVEFAAETGAQTGTYRYSYQIQPTDNNKTLLFRLKQVNNNGAATFSAVHAVKLSANTNNGPALYPNPVKGPASVVFSDIRRGAWDVEIYGVSGQLIKRYHFNNALTGKVNTNNELGKGVYMVKCVNKTTQEKYIERLIVN